jgi:hypothetical protein
MHFFQEKPNNRYRNESVKINQSSQIHTRGLSVKEGNPHDAKKLSTKKQNSFFENGGRVNQNMSKCYK